MKDKSPLAVYAVILVSFDHALGPTVEWSYPASVAAEAVGEEINRNLPFLALPDGAHLQTEDYSYFHLFLPHMSVNSTIFGISCNRQIVSTDLINPGADVTRSTVQKAVVVLANQPVFGCIRDKLGFVTRALFAQRDFTDRSILEDFYHSLVSSFELGLGEGGGEVQKLSKDLESVPTATSGRLTADELTQEARTGSKPEEESKRLEAIKSQREQQRVRSGEAAIYMGTNLRELIHHFRLKTLQLVKLLLLQRRIMFYGHPVENLCTYQYSLVSLLPCLLVNLEDSGSPVLAERSQKMKMPTSLKTSDRHSLLKYFGLPLDIFGQDSFFQPYLPLQQIELLKASTYLVGTTNTIFQQQKDARIDAIANIELATLEIKDPKLAGLVALTPADRKWMDELIAAVDSSWNPDDPSRPVGNKFVGSDDYLRREFENYVCSVLSVMKYSDYLENNKSAILGNTSSPTTSVSAFNDSFVHAFKKTCAFQMWDRHTDTVIFDLIDPRHPCEGRVSVVEDVGIWLSHGIKDLKLDETISKSSESVWRLASSIKTDLVKRQADYRDRLSLSSEPNANEALERKGSDTNLKTNSAVEGSSGKPEGNKEDSKIQGAQRTSSIASTFSSFLFGGGGEKSSSASSTMSTTAQTRQPEPKPTLVKTPPVSPSMSSFFRYS
ncbi:transport protein Avl9-domain-containing protein [Phakopsora pachyrhizi]|uniref:Transport protein Avl9-domain-containing protein n=1 Tax=Phakopsora pachyrhizi TaxID=170000 RepID=A0AAV0AL66_PHAPC|nr:transport protein Avl9-domain-containing protein [Phakopsora pachyrhizi]CAH7669416.1 transport protein Avl9-domain-containing protein [Phakopsora pachyrhizi]